MRSCPRVLHVFFSCFSRVLRRLDPRGRLGGLAGKVGSACEKFEDNEVVYWVMFLRVTVLAQELSMEMAVKWLSLYFLM